jgi:hypothetical protein
MVKMKKILWILVQILCIRPCHVWPVENINGLDQSSKLVQSKNKNESYLQYGKLTSSNSKILDKLTLKISKKYNNFHDFESNLEVKEFCEKIKDFLKKSTIPKWARGTAVNVLRHKALLEYIDIRNISPCCNIKKTLIEKEFIFKQEINMAKYLSGIYCEELESKLDSKYNEMHWILFPGSEEEVP